MLSFFRKLILDFENNNLDPDMQLQLSNFYLQHKFKTENTEWEENKLLNFLALGWFISHKKNNCDFLDHN